MDVKLSYIELASIIIIGISKMPWIVRISDKLDFLPSVSAVQGYERTKNYFYHPWTLFHIYHPDMMKAFHCRKVVNTEFPCVILK